MRQNIIGQRYNLVGGGMLAAVGRRMRMGYAQPVVGCVGGVCGDSGQPSPSYDHCHVDPYCAPPGPATMIQNGVDPRVYGVQNCGPSTARRYTLSFESANIPAGAIVDVVKFPQVIFRSERLFIPSSIAPDFSIVSITIGNRPQYAASGAVPAEMFTEVAINNELGMDTAQPGVQIILQVRNDALEAKTFRAAMIGAVVETCC